MRISQIVRDTTKSISSTLYTITGLVPLTGNQAFGIVSDGSHIWASTNNGGMNVAKIDPATATILTNDPGPNIAPWGLVYDGTNVWCVDRLGNKIYKHSISTGSPVAFYATDSFPEQVAFDGSHLWVTSNNSGAKLDKIDPTTGTIVATISYIGTGFGSDDVLFDGTNIWACAGLMSGGAGVIKVDITSNTIVATSAMLDGAQTRGLTFDGTYIYTCTNSGGSVIKINRTSLAVVGTFPALQPVSVLYANSKLWVGNNNGGTSSVQGVDPITLSSFVTIPLGNTPGTLEPFAMTFDGIDSLWVNGGAGSGSLAVRKIRII